MIVKTHQFILQNGDYIPHEGKKYFLFNDPEEHTVGKQTFKPWCGKTEDGEYLAISEVLYAELD